VQRRKPVRVDMRYVITAWATEPEDEHRLLSRTLMALLRSPVLPADILPEAIREQPAPIQLVAAQADDFPNASDLWSALDNEVRPSIICVATMALDAYQPFTTPLVRTRELRVAQVAQPELQRLEGTGGATAAPDVFWTIGGIVQTDQPLEKVHLTFVERGQDLVLGTGGRFTLGPVPAGRYSLQVVVDGRPARRYEITVPAADYVLDV